MFGKICIHGENYSCCRYEAERSYWPQSGTLEERRGTNGRSDPFFLGWIRTKGEEPIPGRGCKRRWRRRGRKLKRKCGTLETCSRMTRKGARARGRQCDCSLLARLALPRTCCCSCFGDRYPSVQKGTHWADPESLHNFSLFYVHPFTRRSNRGLAYMRYQGPR